MNRQLHWNYSSKVSFYAGTMSSKITVTEAQELTKMVHLASIKSVEDEDFVLQTNRPCIDISNFMETIKNGKLLMLVFRLDLTKSGAANELHIYDSSSATPCPCTAGARIPSSLRLPKSEEGEKILLFRDVSLTHFTSRTVAVSADEEAGCYSVVLDFSEVVYPRIVPLHNLPTTATFLPNLLSTIASNGLGLSSVKETDVDEEAREFLFMHVSEGLNKQFTDPEEWHLRPERSVPNQSSFYESTSPNCQDLRRYIQLYFALVMIVHFRSFKPQL